MGRYWIMAAALFLRASCAHAGTAEKAFSFLALDAGARPAALGGAYAAHATGPGALRYNPAGLAGAQAHEAAFSDNRHFQGVSHQYAVFAHRRGWAAGVEHLSAADIPRTTISQPNETLGDFGLRDVALSAGYGRSVIDGVEAGIALKYLRETIDDVAAGAYAADLGVRCAVPRIAGLTLGAAVQNLGPAVRFEGAEEALPTQLRAGAAYSVRAVRLQHLLALDVTQRTGRGPDVHFGIETLIARRMHVRFGFTSRGDVGPGIRVGFGWNVHRYSIDYAFIPAGDLGASHRLSLGVRWGDAAAPAAAVAEAAEPIRPRRQMSSLEAGPGKPDPRVVRATELMEAGRYAQAEQELRSALGKNESDMIQLYERLGRIEYLRRDFKQARRHYRQAIRLGLRLGVRSVAVAESYAGIGFCLLRGGERDEARKFFEKALQLGPSIRTMVLLRKQLAGP
ncbi:MAG: PorV/PorQ family protein [Elusimicrobiota bacterium]